LTTGNLRILGLSDRIVLVITPDALCRFKTSEFFRQAAHTGILAQTGFMDKVIPIINKAGRENSVHFDEYGLNIQYAVPYISDLWTCEEDKYTFDLAQEFRTILYPLVHKLCSGHE